MRCQEALDGSTTFEMKTELQQQKVIRGERETAAEWRQVMKEINVLPRQNIGVQVTRTQQ